MRAWLCDPDRPVQFIFAGKAHPADRPGQGVIQTIFERSRSERLRGRVFILEDYDMRVAPLPGPGRGRLAQQPAPPAGGLRHERHEGGHERRRQLSPSSTAGGTRATTGATAGPSAAARRTPTRAPRTGPMPRTSTGSSRRRSCRCWYERDADGLPTGWLARDALGSRAARCGSSPRRACWRSTWSRCTCQLRPPRPGRVSAHAGPVRDRLAAGSDGDVAAAARR